MFKAQSLVQEKYTAYKYSGVEWLYEVPGHWKVVRFKFLSSITTGNKNTEDKVDTGAYPFYVRSQTPELIDSYSFDGEAILTAGDGAGVGKVYHYVNGKFDFHQRVYKFSDFKHAAGKFLFRYLESNFFKVATLGEAKSTVDSLRLPLIQDFLVCFPENKTEQASIVKFVDLKSEQIDQTILVKERQIELLKERKQILIQQAVTRGLDPNKPMRASGIEWIGEIPAHWQARRFKYLFSQSQLSVRPGDGVVTSYRDGQVTLRSNRRLSGYTEAILEGGYQGVRKGQLVLNSMDAFEGAIGVSESDGKCTPEYVVCDALSDEYLPEYFAYLLREMALARYIQVICNAVRQRAVRIRFNNLASRFMVVPPIEEQRAIVAHIKAETDKQEAAVALLEQQISKLKEYKATLINSAVTGKIKVPGVVEPTEIEEREIA